MQSIWSIVRSYCSFTLSPPPKDHLSERDWASFCSYWFFRFCLDGKCMKGRQDLLSSYCLSNIFSWPWRSLSQPHNGIFLSSSSGFVVAFFYSNMQFTFEMFHCLAKIFFPREPPMDMYENGRKIFSSLYAHEVIH